MLHKAANVSQAPAERCGCSSWFVLLFLKEEEKGGQGVAASLVCAWMSSLSS